MYRLLIADDEQLERDALRLIVEENAPLISDIRDAANGRAAVAGAAEFRPDICFLDIKMPGMSGIEAGRRIRQQFPHVRIVFLTAFDYFDYAQEAIKIGVEDFIIKPAADREVLAVLQKIIADLEREHMNRERTESELRRLGHLTEVLENEIIESLSRGYVDPRKLGEYLSGFDYPVRVAAARVRLDLSRYPMQIEGEAQASILRRRCAGVVRGEFAEAGGVSLAATSGDDITLLCILPDDADLSRRSWEEILGRIVKRIRVDFTVGAQIGLSSELGNPSRVAAVLEEAEAAVSSAIPGRPITFWSGGEAYHDAGDRPDSDDSAIEAERLFAPEELENRMVRAVTEGSHSAAGIVADDVVSWAFAQEPSDDEAAQRLEEFFVIVRHAVARRFPRCRMTSSWDGDFSGGRIAAQREARRRAAELVQSVRTAGVLSVPARVTRVSEYVQAHFAEDLSLDVLSRVAGMSVYHLSRLFKRHMGMSTVEFVNGIRISRAKWLLKEGTLPVHEVSRLVGFSDAAYFSRVFRSLERTTPTAFRNRSVHSQQENP